ncbi:MAG: tRNA lysidine(34) synthetase TilS [Sphingomonas sp.]
MRDGSTAPPPDPVAVARFLEGLNRPLTGFASGAAGGRFGVAVSGGPDSLALLLLAHAARPGTIEAATVDHGLRPEAAAEAEMVADACARLGVPHAILRGPWDGPTSAGLQAAARAHRYRLLERWCDTRDLGVLLTAHHADDQAETLLMRLSRGAGVGGLGGIRPARPLTAPDRPPARDGGDPRPVLLVRPLLGFAKAELVAVVADAGLAAVHDPSNDSDRFDRTRARRLLAATPWLRPGRIAASARHLAEAEAALAWTADREYARRVEERDDGGATTWLLDPEGLPEEILRRLVLVVWRKAEGHAAIDRDGIEPRGAKLARFTASLRAGERAMLGRVLARPGPRWRFAAAPPRRNP